MTIASEAATRPSRIRVAPLPRPTREGWQAAALSAGLLYAAVNTGNNLFFLIFSAVFGTTVLGFFLAGRVLCRARVFIEAPPRGRVGVPLRVSLRIENTSHTTPLPAIDFDVAISSGEPFRIRTPPVAAGCTERGVGRLTPAKRGAWKMLSATAAPSFPWGLIARRIFVECPEQIVLIGPRPQSAQPLGTGRRRGEQRDQRHPHSRGEEPMDAREYRPGDDARTIDWKASARSLGMVCRDRKGAPPVALQIELGRCARSPAAFEKTVSSVAGAAIEALARGESVGFVSDQVDFPPRSGPAQQHRILDYLATVRPLLSVESK